VLFVERTPKTTLVNRILFATLCVPIVYHTFHVIREYQSKCVHAVRSMRVLCACCEQGRWIQHVLATESPPLRLFRAAVTT
jgi:hypothetical protein